MSNSIENPIDWYEANNFNAQSAIQETESIISGHCGLTNPGSDYERARYRRDTYSRFYGVLPRMFASKGISILQDNRGLSIRQMVEEGLLGDQVLRKLEPSFRFDHITNQGGYGEFAYHGDRLIVPDSPGLTLREQMGVVYDHCKAEMGQTIGIFPGIHNLRDTVAFVLAYHSAHGRYPLREATAFRTFDLLWVNGQEEYHPTVWLYRVYRAGWEEKLVVEVTRADSRDFGTVAPFFWKPS